ncbi:carbohydrate porin [Bradyrhizobium sp. Arg62]|uniref:carbohydrate porin n=1 Tax=Bradyrhizobium brasilense TaxID=1419277 RepID=UPI001E45EC67|nr:carbohydrate porin [Bradyrhizobium brasilense]MCC8943937.1 carbohydrate porin [Bradyrhizobium brasilense]
MNQQRAVTGDQTVASPSEAQLHRAWYRAFCVGSLSIAALVVSDMSARAEFVEHKTRLGEAITDAHAARAAPAGKNASNIRKRALRQELASAADGSDRKIVDTTTSQRTDLRELNKRHGVKGWNIPFPSYSDSLLRDEGGWRSGLASAGFGFQAYNIAVFEANMLDTPRQVPSNYPPCTPRYSQATGAICAGNQTYFGQRPSYINETIAWLTYDMSRWGVPDGQLMVAGLYSAGNDVGYLPNSLQLYQLAWYQTFLDKKLEIKFGYVTNTTEFIGTFVGSNLASTFGPSGSIPIQLGMSISPTPSFRTTWHVTDTIYNQAAVQRSLPINSVTGNVIFDEALTNPAGINWNGPKGTRELFIDELGYKRPASPGNPQTWLRLDLLYNTSTFRDFSHLPANPGATRDGNFGVTFLADRQLWQQDRSSPVAAARGLYAGISVMYAPPEATGISQYYEGRAYWIGPFDNRPTDMFSVVAARNVVSHYLSDATNQFSGLTGVFAARTSNSVTATYTAHLMPGLWGTIGVGYTDHPSLAYFKTEGPSFNVLASLLVNM